MLQLEFMSALHQRPAGGLDLHVLESSCKVMNQAEGLTLGPDGGDSASLNSS